MLVSLIVDVKYYEQEIAWMYKCVQQIEILKNFIFLIGFNWKASHITCSKVEYNINCNRLSPPGKTKGIEFCVFWFQKQQWVYKFIPKAMAKRNTSKLWKGEVCGTASQNACALIQSVELKGEPLRRTYWTVRTISINKTTYRTLEQAL